MTELESDAKLVLGNALIAARNLDNIVVQGPCGSFDGCGDPASIGDLANTCLLCALLEFQDIEKCDDVETKSAEILLVDTQWILDLLNGFDGDKGQEIEYRAAHRIGRALWRKYGDN